MKKLAISLVLLMLLLTAGASYAQDRPFTIFQFGGLNTASGDFAIKPDQCRIASEIDWGANIGSITKRRGYDSVSSIPGQDSAIDIYSAYYSDGTQQLIFVTDSADVGYGNVYASPEGKAEFVGKVTKTISFNTYDSYTYADTLTVDGSPTPVEYISDGSSTCSEVAHGIADTINNNSVLTVLVTALVDSIGGSYRTDYCKWWVDVQTDDEGITLAITTDTAQNAYTKGNTQYTQIWTNFAIFNKPSFAMFDDVVFGVNGSHKGFAYNGDVARSWPLNAPGEPTIVPLKTDGPLDGEYRYAFTYLRGLETADSTYETVSIVSTPIRAMNGQVLLRDFPWVGADSTGGSTDSVGVVVYRTRANPGRLDQRDSAFLIDTVWGTSAANLATLSLQDSVADVDLANGLSIWVEDFIGRDSLGSIGHRYGAPTFLARTAISAPLYRGGAGVKDTLGFSYKVTFIDTVFNISSAAGAPLSVIMADTASLNQAIRVGFPLPPDGDSGIVRNLYRANIVNIAQDSTPVYLWQMGGYTDLVIGWRYTLDTIMVDNYYLVDQISLDSVAYTDSIPYDSLSGRPLYAPSTPPPFVNQIFAHNGRMFGVRGSRLYLSRLDTATSWGALDFISLDESDGDQGVLAFPSRGVIRFLKNGSSFNIYQDANLNWNRQEVSNYLGCIAARSHAAGPLGHYYLSAQGVVREADGAFLERTQAIELISSPLDNFEAISITARSQAEGTYFDQKYMLTIPFTSGGVRVDTTYVYDERSKSWATWSIPFSGATLYGTETALNFLPPDSLYFIKRGDSDLYQYGLGKDDDGSQIRMKWRSAPFGMTENLGLTRVSEISLITEADDATDEIYAYLYDENGTVVDISSTIQDFVLFDSLTTRYKTKGVLPNGQLYYSLELTSGVQLVNSDARVDGIVIRYSTGEEPGVE